MDEKTFKKLISELQNMPMMESVSMSQILDTSDEIRDLLTWLIRLNRFQVDDMAEHLEISHSRAQLLLFTMMNKGLIAEIPDEDSDAAGGIYRTNLRIIPKYRVPKDISNIFD